MIRGPDTANVPGDDTTIIGDDCLFIGEFNAEFDNRRPGVPLYSHNFRG